MSSSKAEGPARDIADIERIERAGFPSDLPESTYEMIRRRAVLDPDAPALSYFPTVAGHREPQRWSYGELLRDITRAANFFHEIGVGRTDVIASILPNLPETHFTLWGGEAAGIVASFNPLLDPAALAALLEAVKPKVLVTTALPPELAAVANLDHIVLVNPSGGDASEIRLGTAMRDGVTLHDFRSSIARQPGDALMGARGIAREDLSSFFCTGGTTGLPKIARRRQGNEVANAWSAGRLFGAAFGPGKTLFCGLPLFHVNAAMVTGLVPFSQGGHVLLGTPEGYRAEGMIGHFWEIVERHRVNFFSAVPTVYAGLLQVPVGEHDISSLEYGLCGAAPMPVELIHRFQERTGVKILEGYGLTEAACVSSVNPPGGECRPGSIGLRIPGQKMKTVLLGEDGRYLRDCAVGEPGLIVICGPNVFAGYLSPEHDKGLWIECGDGDRWLNTGDIGRQDEEGYFWLTGRKKDLIIRGGHNIDPAAIEEPLHRHPAVQMAAAIGRPDIHSGEVPVAYVQLRPGAQASEAELAEHARATIAERAAVPKVIRIVEKMPLTAVGKIFKPALRRLEATRALSDTLNEAGLTGAEVSVAEEPARGLVAAVAVPDAAALDAARVLLEQFPIAFDLHIRPAVRT